MRYHSIKVPAPDFMEIAAGRKDFVLLENSRDFQVGDYLLMTEFSKAKGCSGNECLRPIKYILEDTNEDILQPGYCILGLGFDEQTDICVKSKTSGKVYTIDSFFLKDVMDQKSIQLEARSPSGGKVFLAASDLQVAKIKLWEDVTKYYEEVEPKQAAV